MKDETEQSSEVKEEDLAQEALDATEDETSPADESELKGVPIAKHAKLRERAQQAEVAQARAEGELAAVLQQQTKLAPPPKSPLDLEIERQAAEGIAEDDMTITPALYRKQHLYDQQIANQKTEDSVRQELLVKQQASANRAKVEIEDWQQIVLTGDGLLTPGEAIDIAACGDDFGQVCYDKCKVAIERNAAKSESETDTAPEKKLSESEAEAKVKAEAEKVPTQQEILKDLNVDPATEAAAQL